MKKPKFLPVVIESPYAARNGVSVEEHREYLNRCIFECIIRGETPYASHKMLTDSLNDEHPAEREAGIRAGLDMARLLVSSGARPIFYLDYGMSPGMEGAKQFYAENNVPIESRLIGKNP